MNEVWVDILGVGAVIFLVLLNAFFVAAEFALVSVRPTRITELIEKGNSRARWVQKAISDPDRFIAAEAHRALPVPVSGNMNRIARVAETLFFEDHKIAAHGKRDGIEGRFSKTFLVVS